jgi:hypothetical protein
VEVECRVPCCGDEEVVGCRVEDVANALGVCGQDGLRAGGEVDSGAS